MADPRPRDDYWHGLGISEGLARAAQRVGEHASAVFLYADPETDQEAEAKALRRMARKLHEQSETVRPERRCHTYEHTRRECPGDRGK